MEIGTLCRLSTSNMYVSLAYRGLTLILLHKGTKQTSNPADQFRVNGFDCFVVEKSVKLWFFDYQLSDAEILS